MPLETDDVSSIGKHLKRFDIFLGKNSIVSKIQVKWKIERKHLLSLKDMILNDL